MKKRGRGKTPSWFSHDTNAASDEKIMKLLVVYGYKGYGWFWRIVELMVSTKDYRLGLKGKHALKSLSDLLRTSDKELKEFLDDCMKEFIDGGGTGLFSTDGETFWSDSLRDRMKRLDEVRKMRRELGSKGGRKRWHLESDPKAIAKKGESNSPEKGGEAIATKVHSKTMPSRGEDRIGEERREEKRKDKIKDKIKAKEATTATPSYSRECQWAFVTWNNQEPLIKHRELTPIMQKQYNKCWKRNGGTGDTHQLILQGIKNYGMVIGDPSAFFKYRWTFTEFLTRENAMAMFGVSEEDCRDKFKGREKKVNGMVDGDEVTVESNSEYSAFQSYLFSQGLTNVNAPNTERKTKYWDSVSVIEGKPFPRKMRGKGITKHWRLFAGRGKK